MCDLSRRDFVTLSLVGPLGAAALPAVGAQHSIVETPVAVNTPDGTCDAAFIHPESGSHAGVLIWHDSLGLRPAMRELGRRIASEGYAVLVPNLFYRAAKAPVFDESFNYAQNAADRERYDQVVSSFFAPGAADTDAIAYVSFLDAQPQVDTRRKIGTHGYCLGGPFAMRTAGAVADRVGACASFHGGFLVTDKPDSPHLLAPKIKGRLYFAIASDDDRREPLVKSQLKQAFVAANDRCEIEVYPGALHGWCVPDDKAWNEAEAARAWNKLVALYKSAL